MTGNLSYRVIIVGGGVIGLTTACTLLKEYASMDNLQLTIISETFSPHTTGDISGGFWEPHGFDLNDQRVLNWARYTYDIFIAEYFSIKAASAGVFKLDTYIIRCRENQESSNNDILAEHLYLPLVQHYRLLDDPEIRMFDHLKPSTGFVMTSVVAEVQRYLPQLRRFLEQDSRVKFIQKKITSLNELKNEADVVINCSGFGSRDLVGDLTVRPARGQIIRICAPWIKSMYRVETANGGIGYIIPQSDSVVLGGTFQIDDWNAIPTEIDTQHIRSICAKILPAIGLIQDGQVQVGFRPYRDDGVRLEHERTADGIDVVHCYGHSGAGVTLSWGCAKDVVQIVKTLLPIDLQQPNKLPEHEQLWRLVP